MSDVRFPVGYRLEALRREHPRKNFLSGQALADDWLRTKALQNQAKHLSATKVLLDQTGAIAGYYTLAPTQIDFSDLPAEVARKLPQRLLPAAVLAWLGISAAHQRRGLGSKLLGKALHDCWEGGKVFPFVAVIFDCVDEQAKVFYQNYGFAKLPGQSYRLFLSAQQLDTMMQK